MRPTDEMNAYAESDADDEYEQACISPAAGSMPSPYDRSASSNEPTPTTFDRRYSLDRLPETLISDWNADQCADFIATIGLGLYSDRFIENEIVGEALVALQHDDLKSMAISSVGHRLTILKSIYDVKKAQAVPIEIDHYVPLSADAEAEYATATLKDIKLLVERLRLRDERMSLVEQDVRRLGEDFKRLREDVLPALRLAKDAAQPLPNLGGNGYESSLSPPVVAGTPSTGGQSVGTGGLKRQFSARKVTIGPAPKNSSPTHLQTNHDRTAAEQQQTLDPSAAAERAVLSSSHLNAANAAHAANGGGSLAGAASPQYPGPNMNMPSPTSPNTAATSTTLASRSYRAEPTPARSIFSEDHPPPSSAGGGGRDGGAIKATAAAAAAGAPAPISTGAPKRRETPAPDGPGGGGSVEIFKSFRVSMDDPCYKVLPAALKKYQINAPWDHYALFIVYGDQERCLGLDEKPLILFKQLDKEGKKPMFMLRKTNTAQAEPGDGLGSGGLGGGTRPYDPPGGII